MSRSDTGYIPRPAESGHWYTLTGEPAYEVKAKDGSMRPATLRDARKLNLVPSVTTIIKCAAAPGLETWKQNQVLLAALTLPRQPGESDESFCDRIIRDSQEQARKARDRGTEIHAAVQGHFEGKAPTEEFWPHVKATAEAIARCGADGWIAEKAFAHHYGFGGKCDLHCASWVIDFKTKECDEETDLKTWDEHAMQIAAYREGLGVPNARGGIVYVSTSKPGFVKLLELSQDELERGWRMFQSLLIYWQSKTGHYPRKEKVAA